MRIRRMTATFGKLQEQVLELQDGLNILQAPNETGKSTWCAFLLSMFYGINTKERDRGGVLADKNRYAPWSGVPMSGRLDCVAGGENLTLFRTTRRQTAPMGELQALYTGTADPVPGLTAANCGEELLGVSREVYARSAFIRQGGVAVSQDPGLERRIAALITSGEEDTSYSEAVELLKKQLNRRRHNKTGQLPALEAELQETEALLASQAELVRQRENLIARSAELEAKEAALDGELTALDRWDVHCRHQALRQVEDAAAQAEEKAAALRRRLEEEQIPENDVTGRLRGAIVNLNTVRKSAEKAQEEYQAAKDALDRAEDKLSASPFAGRTAEEAHRAAADPLPDFKPPRRAALLTALLGLCAAGGVGYGVYIYMKDLYAALGAAAGVLVLALIAALLIGKRAVGKARTAALTGRYGTAVPSEISALAETYAGLLSDRDAAQAEAAAKSAASQGLWQSVDVNADGILEEVRRFAPAAYDIPSADAALRASALLRKELADADKTAREARIRADLQAQQAPALPEDLPAPAQPVRDRRAVTEELDQVRADLTALRSNLDRIAGRLHATGDPLTLRADAERLTDEIASLEGDRAAIELALSTLAHANTQLQGRFSPALGRRAAEIFGRLTGGAYDGVLLDKSLRVSAEPTGAGVPRDVGYLSAGAADQLYLAVRLAICDLVLPAEDPVPIVLDDALASFDDGRCAAALDYLREAAQRRQILLFTCHSREAYHFKDDPRVSIQVLTAPEEKV
ncbi:ATP-binding protein [uncultured Oscillibacter sp.]|uniref:ATP-binding protein n=2 Tax=uncultured Oscillibacter sp. TaxID=876091 RepID=UPI002622F83D|nr:AAA family ATPase [uncultured Oscillibacter sp.]